MIRRSLMLSLPLRGTVSRTLPLSLPKPSVLPRQSTPLLPRYASNQPRPRFLPPPKSQIMRRFASNQPFRRFPPPPPPRQKPMKKIYTRYNEEDARSAEPLFTAEHFNRFVKHPITVVVTCIVVGGGAIFYVSHLEEVPISGRRRFNCFSEETVEQVAQSEYQTILDDAKRHGALLPEWDPRARMVERVLRKLIPASGSPDANWEVHVLESPEVNAFVLPGGKVFVYTAILPIAQTDDGLAAILGHEIAHNVARHSAESMSRMVLIYWPIRIIGGLIDVWVSGGQSSSGFGTFLGSIFGQYGVIMPASRMQEREADHIGLMIMAKSCYDPAAAVGVWERMEAANEKNGKAVPEFMSTHPSDANRATTIRGLLPKAEDARNASDCAATIGYTEAWNNALRGEQGVWSLLR